ncbi:hypothetical protein F2P81_005936 [Scophthalmus maximus]|uniref:Uncharacterized protein n=1 Tax=Scophthalmus maximus TaxID=52904 RepID=A0A6A4TGQ1_SCOMX|nr:hypothetical protein F2P81_005936 [Scophthalmus maximus]
MGFNSLLENESVFSIAACQHCQSLIYHEQVLRTLDTEQGRAYGRVFVGNNEMQLIELKGNESKEQTEWRRKPLALRFILTSVHGKCKRHSTLINHSTHSRSSKSVTRSLEC